MMPIAPTQRAIAISAAGLTDIGRVRSHNEDSVLLRPDLHLYIVADGAGGHNAGEVASALAARSIANYFEATEAEMREAPHLDDFGIWTGARRLGAAVHRANREIVEVSNASNQHRGMGTTVVAVLVAPTAGVVHVAHVGDSRCYRLRSGFFEQLTEDHALLLDVLELHPDAPPETLARLPRNVITRALGMEAQLRVPVRTFELGSDDRYLLCSDGLTSKVAHGRLRELLGAPLPGQPIAESLIAAANDAGGNDNVSALVILCASLDAFASQQLLTDATPQCPIELPLHPARDDSQPEISLASVGEREAPRGVVCKACGEPIESPFCPFCGIRCEDIPSY